MRKIEKQMIEAINSGNDFKSTNTEVVFLGGQLAHVYLHGHKIATVKKRIGERFRPIDEIEADRETFRNWPTATTRSRLKALGIDASIKNFEACIDGIAL